MSKMTNYRSEMRYTRYKCGTGCSAAETVAAQRIAGKKTRLRNCGTENTHYIRACVCPFKKYTRTS